MLLVDAVDRLHDRRYPYVEDLGVGDAQAPRWPSIGLARRAPTRCFIAMLEGDAHHLAILWSGLSSWGGTVQRRVDQAIVTGATFMALKMPMKSSR